MKIMKTVGAAMMAVVCGFVGGARGQSFPYLDVDGVRKNASPVTVITTVSSGVNDGLTTGWYLIRGHIDYFGTITVSGDVNLILEDGSHLTATGTDGRAGIHVPSGNTLTIYAQSIGASAGKLTALGGPFGGAGIGSAVAERGGKGQFFDARDGKMYTYVTIGGKKWMAENLNYETASGSWCYGDNNSNCDTYGRLYTWDAALTACPAGWHLPSDAEWGDLVTAAGGESSAGGKLKSSSGWNSGGDSDDGYGFSALPGGGRWSDRSFDFVGSYGLYWSATENDATNARLRLMVYDNGGVASGWSGKSDAFSVRCQRD